MIIFLYTTMIYQLCQNNYLGFDHLRSDTLCYLQCIQFCQSHTFFWLWWQFSRWSWKLVWIHPVDSVHSFVECSVNIYNKYLTHNFCIWQYWPIISGGKHILWENALKFRWIAQIQPKYFHDRPTYLSNKLTECCVNIHIKLNVQSI